MVAEGVETARQLDLLRKLGCRFVQGYLPGRPSDGQKARTLLQPLGVDRAGASAEVVPYRPATQRTATEELAEAELPE